MTATSSTSPPSRNGPAPKRAHAEYSMTLAAPAPTLYRLLSEVERWPLVFGPVVYAAAAESRPHGVNLWLHADGRVERWSGELWTRPYGLRFEFHRQPAASGSGGASAAVYGSWDLEALASASTRVTLSWRTDPADADAIHTPIAVADPAGRVADLAAFAELGDALDALVFSFEDTLRAAGDADDALWFLSRVQDWPGAISHVATVKLDEPEPGVQFVHTGVRTPDGGVHEIPSVRICLPDRIVYTPLTVPPFASAHLGEWIVARRADGTAAITGRHAVALHPDRIAAAFGPHATPADARSRVRAMLGAHSLATLEAARSHAESRTATQPGG